MKRMISLLLTMVVAMGLLTACGKTTSTDTGSANTESTNADSGAEGEFIIKIAHNSSEENSIHKGYLVFQQVAQEKSGGRIKVEIYPNAQLGGGDEDNADMVANNVVQMTAVPTYTLAAIASIDGYKLCDIPYLFTSNEQIYAVMEGEIGRNLAAELLDKTGIMAFDPYIQGWLKLATTKQAVTQMSDVNGLKIRTSQSDYYINLVNGWGGNATPMAYGELFTALQQGTVDGVVTTTPLYIADGLYQVLGNICDVNALTITHVPIFSGTYYDALPDDMRAVVDEAMDAYIEAVRQYHDDAEAGDMEKMAELGMNVNYLSDEAYNEFKDAAAFILEDGKKELGADFVDAIQEVIATVE